MVKINGVPMELAGQTLATYLENTDYNPKRIAIERNGEIVPKSQYTTTILENEDVIEIGSFVGGG